jgi:hypothetical protein
LGDLEGSVAAFTAGAAIGNRLDMPAMAFELDIAAATVRADMGDTDSAIGELERVVGRSSEIESVLTASWARTVLGWIELRRDPATAMTTIEQALEEARRIDYSIAVAVGLRSRAYGHLLVGHNERAVAAVADLLDDLIARGALSNLRVLADVAAVAAYRCGHRDWERIAATARSLPITTLVAAGYELVPLPRPELPPVPRGALVTTIRNFLGDVATADLASADALHHAGRSDTDGPSGSAPSGTIVCLGDVFEFSYADRTVAIRATKGLGDIVRLIEAGGSEVHCLELAGVAIEQSSTGEAIDATARRQYEERIRDLQGEVDEAEANSDFERAYRHQIELDQLIEHLSAAIGQGHRTRRSAGSAERARSAVTHRIRATIRQIVKLHARLGAHLGHSINTGTYCSYRPERSTTWNVDRPDRKSVVMS